MNNKFPKLKSSFGKRPDFKGQVSEVSPLAGPRSDLLAARKSTGSLSTPVDGLTSKGPASGKNLLSICLVIVVLFSAISINQSYASNENKPEFSIRNFISKIFRGRSSSGSEVRPQGINPLSFSEEGSAMPGVNGSSLLAQAGGTVTACLQSGGCKKNINGVISNFPATDPDCIAACGTGSGSGATGSGKTGPGVTVTGGSTVSSAILNRNAYYDPATPAYSLSNPNGGEIFRRMSTGSASQISQLELPFGSPTESRILFQVADNGNIYTPITWKNPLIVSSGGSTDPDGIVEISNLVVNSITAPISLPWKQSGSDVFLTGSESYPSINNAITMQKVGIGMKSPGISLAIGDNDTGLDWVSDGKLNINVDATKTNGTPTMSLISKFPNSGYVGIGTTSPTQALTLGVDKNFAVEMRVPQNVSATDNYLNRFGGQTGSPFTRYFVIRAMDSGDKESKSSTEFTCTTSRGTAPKTNTCTIVWDEVPGAKKYRIYYGTSSGAYTYYVDVNRGADNSSTTVNTIDRYMILGTTTSGINYTSDVEKRDEGGSPFDVVPYSGSLPNPEAYVNKITADGDSWINGGGVIVRDLIPGGIYVCVCKINTGVCFGKPLGMLYACN